MRWLSFEIIDRDLAGRVGKLRTKRGIVETPLLLPVVSPSFKPLTPKEMKSDFGCKAIITNAYILKKNYEKAVLSQGIHEFFRFEDTIVTDSGGYQILVYGDVDVSPEDIIQFQEKIGTDVAVILDIPTGLNARRKRAEYTVEETLRRAKAAHKTLSRKDVLWVGPVQGGNHLDLVSHSAAEISKLPFDIYALGSPTQVIEHYLFDVLVDMIIAAKTNLSCDRPFHLFGAGHPFMLAFAVATGCDIFDSAAYALYARRGKYMTDSGTIDITRLRYFPCTCKVCTKYIPQELFGLSTGEREYVLAWHNLNLCFAEIRRIKQAIADGRLWELLELRAKGHPSLNQALMQLKKYSAYLESGTPISKVKGLLYFGSSGLNRPEIFRYSEKIRRWSPSTSADILVLTSQPSSKPFHRSKEYSQMFALLSKRFKKAIPNLHFCVYSIPYGLIPLELDEVYPLSQFEATNPPDLETIDYVAQQVENYLKKKSRYQAIVLHRGKPLGEKIKDVCERLIKPEKLIISPKYEKVWSAKSINNFVDIIYNVFKALPYPSTEDE
ncbi:MAG: tRNA guanosine(15) transglycosylase TgtA [Candidatus Bathyarchaeota archaeon]